MTAPHDQVALRTSLRELAGALVEPTCSRHRLADAVQYAIALAYLAQVLDGPVEAALESLRVEMRAHRAFDRDHFAAALTSAAASL